jgi:hypothetical protein
MESGGSTTLISSRGPPISPSSVSAINRSEVGFSIMNGEKINAVLMNLRVAVSS